MENSNENMIQKIIEERKHELEKRMSENDVNNKFGKTISIKKTLLSCMDMDKFIEKTKEIIDNSEHFSFKNERVKKLIDKNNPKFILTSDILNEYKDVKVEDKEKIDKISDILKPLILNEIITKFSDYLLECIEDEDKFNSLFKDLPYEFSNTLLTRIYTFRVAPSEGNIVLTYFI